MDIIGYGDLTITAKIRSAIIIFLTQALSQRTPPLIYQQVLVFEQYYGRGGESKNFERLILGPALCAQGS